MIGDLTLGLAAADRFRVLFSQGRLFTRWCLHRSRSAAERSDLTCATHHARQRWLLIGWRHLSKTRPHLLAHARRRTKQLARCAVELLLLRQRWLRQAYGIAFRRWAAQVTDERQLNRTGQVLSDAICKHTLAAGFGWWAHEVWRRRAPSMFGRRRLRTSLWVWARWASCEAMRQLRLAAGFSVWAGLTRATRWVLASLSAAMLRQQVAHFSRWARAVRRRGRTLVICNTVVLRELAASFALWARMRVAGRAAQMAMLSARTAQSRARRRSLRRAFEDIRQWVAAIDVSWLARCVLLLRALSRLATHARRVASISDLRVRSSRTAAQCALAYAHAWLPLVMCEWVVFAAATEQMQMARVRGSLKALERGLLRWRRQCAANRRWREVVGHHNASSQWQRYGQLLLRSASLMRRKSLRTAQWQVMRRSRMRQEAAERSWRVAYGAFTAQVQRIDGADGELTAADAASGTIGGQSNSPSRFTQLRGESPPTRRWQEISPTGCSSSVSTGRGRAPRYDATPDVDPPSLLAASHWAVAGMLEERSHTPETQQLQMRTTPQHVQEWRAEVGQALRALPAIFDPSGHFDPARA